MTPRTRTAESSPSTDTRQDDAERPRIYDPLDMDAPPFTDEVRDDNARWAVRIVDAALNGDDEAMQRFPYAVIVMQYETALREAESRIREARS